ncbi:hypothetical protein BY996DRAFT_4579550 [Phakopsora pachyrhizi]|uniref:Uncharacterized protein n=1 Tax=Phakopsora pachyrhizi TaxID=170000 RepID=A0AAV0BFE6_PHAPC|nr:hypothetical protein BY996DRAFT_4579550 [Phakopsora pachyrhizi]CAH7684760.1 hypothetical protein PPACK8108_LOCUS19182 [Phakopsora pachyrhizi]
MDSSNDDLKASNIFDVRGLVVVVTGGGTGIGLMITRGFVSNGAKRVYIVGRRSEVLRNAAEIYQSVQGQIVPLEFDLSEKSSIERLKQEIESREESIDILINNASIIGPRHDREAQTVESIANSLWSADEDESMKVMRTNVLGYYYTSAALLPLLGKSSNNPQIINVSSLGSFSRRAMTGVIYSLTKASITHFTKLLASHLSKTNVRCNAIAPGLYPSEITSGGMDARNLSHVEGTNGVEIPAGRAGTDKEMVATILYLASKNQCYSSGSVILTDGGLLGLLPSTY